ncbi:MAG: sulfotransferase family protein [Solirubrobacteraceae bacterium]
MPDFYIVGSPKTGTTSLYEMLREHPQIYMSDVKEPLFLASDLAPHPKFATARREAPYPRTLESYLALFEAAGPEQRVGEASTFYLWSHTAADRIADLQPRARIIAILRDPATFLQSLHQMFLGWGVEAENDLLRAISLDQARSEGKSLPPRSHRPQLLQYADHVRYVDQLSRYHARLQQDQVLVLIYDDFRNDNQATVRKVLRFLAVDDEPPIQVVNTNVTTRNQRSVRARYALDSLMKSRSPLARSTRRAIRKLTTQRLRRGSVRAFREHVVSAAARPPEQSVMLELRERFKPEVLALSEYLDRDLLSLWGYDGVDRRGS